MTHKLLISGDRATFTTLALDVEARKLSVLANYPVPFNASWVEPMSHHAQVDGLVGLSEGDESGLLYTFEIDHVQSTCRITSQQSTLGAPAHFAALRDGSGLALATYIGGSVALYPMSTTNEKGFMLIDAHRTEIRPEFPYKSTGYGSNECRQRQCHTHQILEDGRGLLYAPDLGSDRVWILRRDSMKLEICGWLQCPAGHGPRHAVMSPSETMMYVIGELSHTIVAFDLSSSPAEAISPIVGFAPNVVPPSVHREHQFMMDSSEICLHPTIPNVLYVSNRWARHIAEREPHLKGVPDELPRGDDVAIALLSSDGRKVESIKHVQTRVDVIRGMRLSDDGKYVVVVGQMSGDVEVYDICGKGGEVWTLVASLNEDLDGGIKHIVWL